MARAVGIDLGLDAHALLVGAPDGGLARGDHLEDPVAAPGRERQRDHREQQAHDEAHREVHLRERRQGLDVDGEQHRDSTAARHHGPAWTGAHASDPGAPASWRAP